MKRNSKMFNEVTKRNLFFNREYHGAGRQNDGGAFFILLAVISWFISFIKWTAMLAYIETCTNNGNPVYYALHIQQTMFAPQTKLVLPGKKMGFHMKAVTNTKKDKPLILKKSCPANHRACRESIMESFNPLFPRQYCRKMAYEIQWVVFHGCSPGPYAYHVKFLFVRPSEMKP